MRVSTQCSEVRNSQTQKSPLNPEDSQKQHPDRLFFHHSCCLPTQRGSRCVCCVLQQLDEIQHKPLLIANFALQERDLRAPGIVYRPLVWTADANHAICSKYRSMPQSATNVSKSPPTQMETLNSLCPRTTKSSHGTSSPAPHISASTVAFGQTHGKKHQPPHSNASSGWWRK